MNHEIDFIEAALNFYWNDAQRNLERNDLGDIEKVMYQKQREHAKNLMNKLEFEKHILIPESENTQLAEQVSVLKEEIHRNNDEWAQTERELRSQNDTIAFELQCTATDKLKADNEALVSALKWVIDLTPAQLNNTKIIKDYLKTVLTITEENKQD